MLYLQVHYGMSAREVEAKDSLSESSLLFGLPHTVLKTHIPLPLRLTQPEVLPTLPLLNQSQQATKNRHWIPSLNFSETAAHFGLRHSDTVNYLTTQMHTATQTHVTQQPTPRLPLQECTSSETQICAFKGNVWKKSNGQHSCCLYLMSLL